MQAAPACRGRLVIGFQVTADRLQGRVEFAYRTDRTQVTTTILWGGRLDDVSRRVLTDALRAAAQPPASARMHAFAVAARDLFRHATRAWAARRSYRPGRGCFVHPTPHPPALDCIPAASPLHDDLLVAARDLRSRVRLQPLVTIAQDRWARRSLQATLSALQELSDLIADYLEQALWPLAPYIGRHAVHAFIRETRREVDDLAACLAAGNVYTETLTITEPGDNTVSIEIEASLGGPQP